MLRVGLVGYSGRKFDEAKARKMVSMAFALIEKIHPDQKYILVSGYTDIGIPGIGYRIADNLGWNTMGVACKKAEEYKCFDVDEVEIVGDDWGDESETFLSGIDMLVRVGGGDQSMEEAQAAKDKNIPVFEFDLEELKDD